MPKWKCINCGYRVEEPEPPQHCPGCHEACTFVDATCYTPDCGLIEDK